MVSAGKRVFGYAGWSGSGKTTLIERVVAHLTAQGVRVALIKHAHHAFDIDHEGKDSYRHRKAGACEVLVSSANRWALMRELRGEAELTLVDAVSRLSPCDLVLVEGYKRDAIPKLEIWRAELGKPLLFPTDPHILGVISDDGLQQDGVELHTRPSFVRMGSSDIAAIADFSLSSAAIV